MAAAPSAPAGGARGGLRILGDSNLDWGQDLPALAKWQREQAPDKTLYLAYFGTADPRAHGLNYRKVVWVHDFRPQEPSVWPESGNLLAVSLNLREGLYLERDRELARAVFARGWMDTATIRRYTEMVRHRWMVVRFCWEDVMFRREYVAEVLSDLVVAGSPWLRTPQQEMN